MADILNLNVKSQDFGVQLLIYLVHPVKSVNNLQTKLYLYLEV